MTPLSVVSLPLCSFIFGVTPSFGCSCIGPIHACEAIWTTDAVFVGRVLDVQDLWTSSSSGYSDQYRSVLLEVDERFKGLKDSDGVVEIGTGMGGGDCGYGFKKDETYLVFGHRDADTGRIWTGICSPTHPVSEDVDDLPYLRSLPTAPSEGRIFGFVESYWNLDEEHGSQWMEGIDIQLDGPKGKYMARTDKEGNYQIERLPAGEYRYRVELPGGKESPRTGQVSLRPKGCVELFFQFEVDSPDGSRNEEGSSETKGGASDPR